MTKAKNLAFKLAWLPLVALPFGVQGQTLTLFEPTETNGAPADQPQPAAVGFLPAGGQPAFTLRSAGRIGDRYHVVLVNRDGTVAKVQWQEGQTVQVPGFGGFTVTQVSSRSVRLNQPETCISAPERGVSCLDSNQAELRLASAAPAVAQAQMMPAAPVGPSVQQDPFAAAAAAAARNPPQPNRGPNQQPLGVVNVMGEGGAQAVVINPFTGQPEAVPQLSPEEQAARMQRQRARAERMGRFVPQRIDDADVPPGMQKVSTPFGDTLVPIQ